VKATVFLGGGRITSALIAGLRVAGHRGPLVVHDRNSHKLRRLRKEYGINAEDDPQKAVAQAGLLIIAVRPDSVKALLQTFGPIKRPIIAISLAAGIPLAKLSSWLGRPVHWVRAMPSPVCRSAQGLTAVAFHRNFSKSARPQVKAFFKQVGVVVEVPEKTFDVFTVTYSSSHGYHALAALADAAEKLGLDRKTALTAAAHALGDGIAYWRDSGLAIRQLLHEAATPGGIAATVMSNMDAAGYKNAVGAGLRAGVAKARKSTKY
jgi:pyrroline-5-carboxylate reductase